MLLLAAAALSASSPPGMPHPRTGATIQAVATIRVIAGARLSFRGPNDPAVPRARDCMINTRDGQQKPARLIEFE